MSELRKKHVAPYDLVLRQAMQDNNISWDATGLLAYLISLPDGWAIKINHIAQLRQAGEKRVRRMLRELEDAGYITRRSERRPDGTFKYVSELYQDPAENPHHGPAAEPPSPSTALPVTGTAVHGGDIKTRDLEIKDLEIQTSRNSDNNNNGAAPNEASELANVVVVAFGKAGILSSSFGKTTTGWKAETSDALTAEDILAWHDYVTAANFKRTNDLQPGFIVDQLSRGMPAPEENYTNVFYSEDEEAQYTI